MNNNKEFDALVKKYYSYALSRADEMDAKSNCVLDGIRRLSWSNSVQELEENFKNVLGWMKLSYEEEIKNMDIGEYIQLYYKSMDNLSAYKIHCKHEDGTQGFIDPCYQSVIWEDGFHEDGVSWNKLSEYIYNYVKEKKD